MRIYLSDFVGTPIPLHDGAYYSAHMNAAWSELLAERLHYDTRTGVVTADGSWISRPSSSDDFYPEITRDEVWEYYLSREVKSRAARLHNRAMAA